MSKFINELNSSVSPDPENNLCCDWTSGRSQIHLNYSAPLKTPFCVLDGSFAPTFAYKNLGRHPVFLRFLTQNLNQNPSPNPSKSVIGSCLLHPKRRNIKPDSKEMLCKL